LKSGYSLNYYFILQTDSSGGKNHTFKQIVVKWKKNRYNFEIVGMTCFLWIYNIILISVLDEKGFLRTALKHLLKWNFKE
jgi:hypothetical protein